MRDFSFPRMRCVQEFIKTELYDKGTYSGCVRMRDREMSELAAEAAKLFDAGLSLDDFSFGEVSFGLMYNRNPEIRYAVEPTISTTVTGELDELHGWHGKVLNCEHCIKRLP